MAYGGWSWAFQPYWAEGVSRYIDHPRAHMIFDDHATDPFGINSLRLFESFQDFGSI